ncbi:MAG: hypothetical protein BRC26_02065, partial [Nanohaloarchaea archaeon QH_8_44_6]
MATIFRDEYSFVTGRGSGNELIDAIDSAENRLWMITQDIDPRYRQKIQEKEDAGIEVQFLTPSKHEKEISSKKVEKNAESDPKQSNRSRLHPYRYLFVGAAILSGAGIGISLAFNDLSIPAVAI